MDLIAFNMQNKIESVSFIYVLIENIFMVINHFSKFFVHKTFKGEDKEPYNKHI